ncbi:MAG: outer membrane lipoprotein chaperone LolA [Acidobacteriota bacterium]
MRLSSIIVSLLLATAASASPIELDRVAAALAGSEAQFTQRFTPKGFKNSQNESGSVIFGTLPMMRWSYVKPEQKTFVFDGSQSWFYIPADRQVTTARIDESRKKELPFLLLGDPVARDKAFTIDEKKSGSTFVTTLQSRDLRSAIRSVVITSSAATHQIARVEYSDREGNRTSFELTGYHPRSTPAETFRFSAPAGVQVVTQ